MPSTYSDLKIELIATGEQSGSWGSTTNINLGTALEEAITGRAEAVFTTDDDLTLDYTNTNGSQEFRNLILNVTSSTALTETRNLIVPTITKQYLVENNTTGSQSIVVKTSAGTGVTVPNGATAHVYADGTNVVQAVTQMSSLDVDNINIDGNTISSTDTDGDVVITPNGAGKVSTSDIQTTGTITAIAADTQDGIVLQGRAGGTDSYTATLTPDTLTDDRTVTVPDATGTVVLADATQTLSNKRNTSRVSSNSNPSSITPDISSEDTVIVTGLAQTLTINAPTGSPVNGDKLLFRIEDNGTARTLSWNAVYNSYDISVPLTTTAGKKVYVGVIYDSDASQWDAVAVVTEG